MRSMIAISTTLVFSTFSISAQATPKAGDWFVQGSALTSFYQYEEDNAR